MPDLLPEIIQCLVDKLREKTGTDYIYAETKLASLPVDAVQEVMTEAVEHFAGRSESAATVADLADVVLSSVRMATLTDEKEPS